MTGKKKADDLPEGFEEVKPETCKNCGNAIENPKGDNGCGIHTINQEPVTNCVAAK